MMMDERYGELRSERYDEENTGKCVVITVRFGR
jgi:hypothetical protein